MAHKKQSTSVPLPNQLGHLKALLKMSHEITGTLDLNVVLKRICDETLLILNAEICSILMLDHAKSALRIMMAQGLEASIVAHTEIPVGRDISGWVAKHRQPLLVTDVERDPRFERRNREKYYTHSLLSSPLICKDTLLGVINVNNKRSRKPFTEGDLDVLNGIASLAAIALHNAKLHEDLQKVYLEVMNAFTSALWAKDPYTKEHSERVSHISTCIAREMGLWEPQLEIIRQACHLHDIGKIGIRDAVLNKPAKLTADEWKEMKLHPLIGAKIIRPLSFLSEVADIVEQEHERWDGHGYPFGLKGEQIHVGARVVSIADAYDAITTDRPYHKAQEHEWAVSELNRCSGTQFDPKAIQAFNQALEKGVPGVNRPFPDVETGSQAIQAAALGGHFPTGTPTPIVPLL
ncbi:MAG: HD domain-containing protein [Candidatus Omnitrophica bacterium]|nr:HD domain-containing protein [Candidatus Omnitrophota bacterium]